MGRNNNNNNNNPLETLGTLAIIYYLVTHFKEVGLFVVCMIIIFSVMFIFKMMGQFLAEHFFSVVDLGWWFLGLIAILVMFILIHKYCVPKVKNFRYYRIAAIIFGCIFISVGIALLVRDYMWFIAERDRYFLIMRGFNYEQADYYTLSLERDWLLPLNALGVSLINGGIVVIIDGCVTAARRLKKLAETVNNNLK